MRFCSTWIIGIELLSKESNNIDESDIDGRFGELIEELKLTDQYKIGINELKFTSLSLSKKN
ncbi:unnamed protein product [Meloidogyne enterolobii]|uniref:Uncharacterized protein n=1 Tax=Meloidogyne enterolobii TaxID=390850 RepID=A0ACB0YVH6_MELEN